MEEIEYKVEEDVFIMAEFYQYKKEDVIEELNTDAETGLSQSEVEERQEEYGPNKLAEQESVEWYEILLDNLNNIIVYLLAAAALLSLFMGDYIEAVAIVIAILISVLTGFVVEWRAAESVDALQEMVNTTVRVIRDGEEEEIESTDLVPGDIIVLSEGDAIAADGRVLENNNFQSIESALTGESEPVDKDDEEVFNEEVPIGDRVNMVYSGTAATKGDARVVVTETAMDTEVGHIQEMLDNEEDDGTPLDKEINSLGKMLIIVAFVAALAVVGVGLFTGQELASLLQIAVILAVAAIPEALPAVQTITLSRGMQQMADREALVKTLPSVETLGSTSIIASDKTGTLTENQMMTARVATKDDTIYEVSGKGYEPEGEISQNDEKIGLDQMDGDTRIEDIEESHQDLARLIMNGVLSSNATLEKGDGEEEDEEGSEEEYTISGDPTDGALTVLGAKLNLTPDTIEEMGWERKDEFPFDSDQKYMGVIVDGPTPQLILKGAPDVLVDMAQLDDEGEQYWLDQNEKLTEEGMRVIALAGIPLEDINANVDDDINDVIENLDGFSLLGMYGIVDPPREDAKESVKQTQAAGIQVKMITGDHPGTAEVIAEQIGIENADKTMTGEEIDESVDSEDFIDKVKEAGVFARVSPENKLQLIDAFRDDGKIIAMTGDGVNDAPALNGADIGIAMGVRGTEVAKESSDMILTDDRFATIVDAVEIGRVIFDNIKKFVSFLFTCNMVEISAVFLAVVFLMPVPLAPLHILYLNLIIDLLPAITLSLEPAEDDVMKRPPRDPESGLVNRPFLLQVIVSGILIGITAFIVFVIFNNMGVELEVARTGTFAFMGVGQLMHVFNVRHPDNFGLDKTILENKPLIGALIASVGLLLLSIYLPGLNSIMSNVPLNLEMWGIILIAAVIITGINFLVKKGIHRFEG